MKTSDFIINSLDIDQSVSLAAPTKTANWLSNCLLSPARYLWNGKSATYVDLTVPNKDRNLKQDESLPCFADVSSPDNNSLVKTIMAVLTVIPATLIGACIKGCVLLASDQMRQRYELMNTSDLNNSVYKGAQEITFAILKNDSSRLKKALNAYPEAITSENFTRTYSHICEQLLDDGQHQLCGKILRAKQIEAHIIHTRIFKNSKLQKFNTKNSINSSDLGPILDHKRSLRKVKNGAVKQLWEDSNKPGKVLITARNGNVTAENELIREMITAKNVSNQLHKNLEWHSVSELAKKLQFSQSTMNFLNMFENLSELKYYVLQIEMSHLIPPQDLNALKEYFENSESEVDLEIDIQASSNLMLDYKLLEDNEKINGLFTVETTKADCDLDELIRDRNKYQPIHAFSMGNQFLNGMASLHAVKYVHGDVKLENALVTKLPNGQFQVLVSDFGKAKHTISDEMSIYWGNTRFNPWEFSLSMPGDVCSTGIALIRILEQQVLHKLRERDPNIRTLIEPKEKGHYVASPKRDGFEVFVIEGKCFSSVEKSVEGQLSRAIKMMFGPSHNQLAEISVEKDRYIDALVEHLKTDHNPEIIDKIGILIKNMTATNPLNRPTMGEAARSFNEFIKDM